MKTEKIEVKGKIGTIMVKGTFDFQKPETWKEAVELCESESKAFQIFSNEFKTNFMDKCRKTLIDAKTKEISALYEKVQAGEVTI